MRDTPTAADLLETARKTLLDELLPELPATQKYNALMVAAAMAIAAREAENGEDALVAEREVLTRLLDGAADVSLRDLNRRFADGLRSGVYDAPGEQRDAAMKALRDSTLARLRECNPGYLDNDGVENP